VTGAERFLKEKELQIVILISDMPYDYLPGWSLSGPTPSSPDPSGKIPPKKIKFALSAYKSAVAPARIEA
jgi:hypothetical protein